MGWWSSSKNKSLLDQRIYLLELKHQLEENNDEKACWISKSICWVNLTQIISTKERYFQPVAKAPPNIFFCLQRKSLVASVHVAWLSKVFGVKNGGCGWSLEAWSLKFVLLSLACSGMTVPLNQFPFIQEGKPWWWLFNVCLSNHQTENALCDKKLSHMLVALTPSLASVTNSGRSETIGLTLCKRFGLWSSSWLRAANYDSIATKRLGNTFCKSTKSCLATQLYFPISCFPKKCFILKGRFRIQFSFLFSVSCCPCKDQELWIVHAQWTCDVCLCVCVCALAYLGVVRTLIFVPC